jgi:hypothetical protein
MQYQQSIVQKNAIDGHHLCWISKPIHHLHWSFTKLCHFIFYYAFVYLSVSMIHLFWQNQPAFIHQYTFIIHFILAQLSLVKIVIDLWNSQKFSRFQVLLNLSLTVLFFFTLVLYSTLYIGKNKVESYISEFLNWCNHLPIPVDLPWCTLNATLLILLIMFLFYNIQLNQKKMYGAALSLFILLLGFWNMTCTIRAHEIQLIINPPQFFLNDRTPIQIDRSNCLIQWSAHPNHLTITHLSKPQQAEHYLIPESTTQIKINPENLLVTLQDGQQQILQPFFRSLFSTFLP